MNMHSKVAEPTILNGVNVTQLATTIEAIEKQPDLARFEFRARNRWMDGTRNMATVGSYYGACREEEREQPFRFLADEPPVLCGRDEGANPVEYLLSALSMCVTTTIVAHSAARGMPIEAVESELSGDLDVRGFLAMREDIRSGYQKITMRMRIKSDAPVELLQELAKLSPVHDVVSRSVPVELSIDTY
jgi:uncharacterized OsmC-like protein